MKIVARIFNANIETYKKIYIDAIKNAYKKDGVFINPNQIKLEIEEIPGTTTIHSQRSSDLHSRTIKVIENNQVRYIIGVSNTNYDEDTKKEKELQGEMYDKYGGDQYHANTYLIQGINKIFNYYFDTKEINPNVKLYFYLLDIERSYPHNLFNLMIYRKLATLGFEILNIDKISFKEFEQLGFSLQEGIEDIGYISFNKFYNDLLFISKGNSSNVPSYLKCVDYDYDISKEKDNDYNDDFVVNDFSKQLYIYTFKTLGAQQYDSLLTMWTLTVLAQKENKNLKFMFAPEKYNFRLGQEIPKFTEGFTKPVNSLIERLGLDRNYETTDEILQQMDREKNQYETAKSRNILRNQELFKNNLRKKGIQTKCYLCGCEIENILEAAHLWGVADIRKTSHEEINNVLTKEYMKDLIDIDNSHHNEQFYKKYVLANSGDNGIWLCSNHHGLFDSNFYCFDSTDGKILFKLSATDEDKLFFKLITTNYKLPEEVLSNKTKTFLSKREELFEQKHRTSDF